MNNKFTVINLDCAACAAKIERGLRQTVGVGEVSLDFASLTLHVDTVDVDRVTETVGRIAPDVELVLRNPGTAPPATAKTAEADASAHQPSTKVWLLASAVVLFFIQLFLEDRFHARGWIGLELGIVSAAYLLAGGSVLARAWRTVRTGAFFDENVLMVIATAGAMAIHAYAEAVAVMIFYKIGEMLQERAVTSSRRSIQGLLAARPDRATLETADGFRVVSPESVRVGDVILVKPGERIPLDGEVLDGRSQVDTSPITGEFKPESVAPGQSVMAGQINQTGALTVRVSRPFAESSIAKIMELVENAAARKADTEKFITTFARYYTPAVVLTAALVAFLPPLIYGADIYRWVYRALVLLVISCPCALVVSIPLGYFGGIGRASRSGILVKGANFIDALAGIKTVVFDKTGTLTHGVFTVQEVVSRNGRTRDQLLTFAAAAEHYSNHPIAVSIREAFTAAGLRLDPARISDHREIVGEGVQANFDGHAVSVGSDNLLHRRKVVHDRCEFETTVAHVSVDGEYAGYLTIGDRVKADAKKAVEGLRALGVDQVLMLTGDNRCAAETVARHLSLDRFHAGLLPEQKVAALEQIMRERQAAGKIAFVGDGINDAPVIARADVGVAMGALGADAAIETADVVLMTDAPSKMAEAVSIAKRTRRIVWQNIGLAFVIKGIFIVLGAAGLASMWEAVFADMGTAVLAVFNATRILRS